MKTLHLLAALAICFTSIAAAGQASMEASSEHTYATIVASWYETHRCEILKAANMEVITPVGADKFKVQSETPIGAWVYVMNESIETKGAVAKIKYTLADKMDTKFSKNTVTITIAPSADGCFVNMKMDQKVDSRIVLSSILLRSQKQSTAAVKEYLNKHLK